MLDGYNRRFNNFALVSVLRPVDNPDPALAIGSAERLDNIGLKLWYDAIVQPIPLKEAVQSSMDSSFKLQDDQYKLVQFPNQGYFGEPLGGNL